MSFGGIWKSDSKLRHGGSKVAGNRSSLQNDNHLFRGRRSISADARNRISGGNLRPRSSSEEKKSSIFPRWSGRKSSLLNDAKSSMKDTRPLADKVYQKKKLLELIEYLQETQFPQPLTLARLMQPSKKDIENIIQHFVNFWDCSYEVKKIEDEAPKMLKHLGYPFIPNKSTFVCVARHNFPALLGVLLFLMDIAKFLQGIDHNLLLSSGESKEQSVLFEYIINCYVSSNFDEQEAIDVFKKIINSAMPDDMDDLQQKIIDMKAKCENAEMELENIKSLKSQSLHLDEDIKKYKEYFPKMENHIQKREGNCRKLRESLAAKDSELHELKAVLAKKQEQYDAQGFDGKKQMSFFESQKGELIAKLQTKKDALKKLQDECWEAEMQYTKNLDTANTTCEAFNSVYSDCAKAAATVLDPLKDIRDPQIMSICSNYKLEFPDCNMQPTQKLFVHGISDRKNFLLKIEQDIESYNIISKGMISKKRQQLHETLRKTAELSVKLKLTTAQETVQEQDLVSKEKLVIEEMKAIDAQCEESLKLTEETRTKRMEMENSCVELREELAEIRALKREKEEMLQEYLKRREELFAMHAKSIEEIKIRIQQKGDEAVQCLEEHLKRKEKKP